WEGLWLRQRGHDQGRYLSGPQATYQATDDWGGASLLHFGCHGRSDPWFAPLSHLCLAADLLLAHDVVYRRPPLGEGALVVLNGCQTAVPDLRALDEGLALMNAFLVRGAGLVLATQWSVFDGPAAVMVTTFLSELLDNGVSDAEALRRSQQWV